MPGRYVAPTSPKLNMAPQSIALPGTVAMGGAPTSAPAMQTAAPVAAVATQSAAAPSLSVSGPSGGSARGGSAAPAAAATAVAARPSLSDYINSNFLYQQQQGANDSNLSNFDAQSLKGQQDTQANQALRTHDMQQGLDQAGNANANDLAAHGLLNSGINFQNQDKINAQGVNQQASIDNLLSDFISGRQQGRLTQEQANRQSLNGVMNQLTQQFNQQNASTL